MLIRNPSKYKNFTSQGSQFSLQLKNSQPVVLKQQCVSESPEGLLRLLGPPCFCFRGSGVGMGKKVGKKEGRRSDKREGERGGGGKW